MAAEPRGVVGDGSPTGALPPVAECIACGHIHTLVVWKDGTGICAACRAASEHLRGPCSPERGCRCYEAETRRRALDQAAADRKQVVRHRALGFTYTPTPPSGPPPPPPIPDTPENRERLRHLYFGDRAGRRVASSSGTGHDAATEVCANCRHPRSLHPGYCTDPYVPGTCNFQYDLCSCRAFVESPPADLPVAAPDPAADTMPLLAIHGAALYAMAEGEPEEAAHITVILARRLREAEAERQQDKERIERAREALGQIHDHADAAVKGRDVRFSVCVGIRALARGARAALAVEEDAPE